MDARTRGKIKVLNKGRTRRYGRDTVLDFYTMQPGGNGLVVHFTLFVDWDGERLTRFALGREFFEFEVADPDNLMRPILMVTSEVGFNHRAGGTKYVRQLDGLRYEVVDRPFEPDGPPLVWLVRCNSIGKRGKG